MTPATIAAISAIASLLQEGITALAALTAGQKVDPTAVLGQIPSMQSTIDAHNAAVDAAEAAKFPQ